MGLEITEFVLEVEEVFALEIPDRDVTDVSTIGDFHQYLCHRLGVTESPPALLLRRPHVTPLSPLEILAQIPVLPPEKRPVWDQLHEIMVRQGAPPDLICSDTRFVQDLGWG